MMILTMAIPNLIGVFLLSNQIYVHLQVYIAKLKSGEIGPQR
jgi:Na+/alanine symporter